MCCTAKKGSQHRPAQVERISFRYDLSVCTAGHSACSEHKKSTDIQYVKTNITRRGVGKWFV